MSDSYNINSILALGTIPADEEDGRAALTRAIDLWVTSQQVGQWPRALQSFENASYLVGNHTTRFFYDAGAGFGVASATNTAPVQGDAPADTIPKTVDNRLPRAVESMAGLLTEVQPAPRVSPKSDTPEDEDAAALSEIVLGLVFERPLRLGALLREAARIGAIFEGVVAENDYAETADRVEEPIIAMEMVPNELDGTPQEQPVVKGMSSRARKDVRVDLWTPLHITVDPAATRPADLTFICRTTFEDVDAIKATYTRSDVRTADGGYLLEKGDEIPVDTGVNHPLYWYTRLQDLLATPQHSWAGGLATGLMQTAGALPNQTLLHVIDVRPSEAFPRGRTLVVAGGKLIYAGDARAWSAKYPWRWHPYSFWSWFNVPGKFFGMGMLSELVPLQKRINAIDNLIQKNREYMAIGQWWLPKHSKVKLGSIGGMPGVQYEYTDVQGLSKPERVSNDALPPDIYAERQSLVQSIEYISGTGILDDQISQSAARAGVVLDFLRNEKLRNKSPMLRDFEAFVENISQNILIDVQTNMVLGDKELTDRVKLAAREYSLGSLQTFSTASLRDHHAVSIDIASELRHTPEAAEQRATEFLQFSQGEMSEAERSGILEAMRLSKYIKSEKDASLQRARRMVSRITQGMPEAFLPLPGIDDPHAMAPEFQREILSDRFLFYPDQIKEALANAFQHYAAEVAALNQQAMEQELMMQGVHPKQMAAQQPSRVVKGAPPEGEE